MKNEMNCRNPQREPIQKRYTSAKVKRNPKKAHDTENLLESSERQKAKYTKNVRKIHVIRTQIHIPFIHSIRNKQIIIRK